MLQKIITPIDGSRHAQMALELSADLAARFDSELVLLHVGSRDGHVPEALYDEAERELKAAEDGGEETGVQPHQSQHLRNLEYMGQLLLRNALEQAKEKGVGHAETVLDVGDTADRILKCAKDNSADLIVMGSRGLGALDGLFLGSVSHKVFHLAPCSCVTVNLKDAEGSLQGLKRILVPTDGSGEADKAVEFASEIAGKYGAELTLVYAMWRGPSLEQLRASVNLDELSEEAWAELDPERHPIAEHISSSFIPPVVSRSALTEIGEQVLERGRQTAEAKGVEAPKVILHDGEPARAIISIAQRENVDLIAMGSRGLGGSEGLLAGSVSYKVSHTAPCSSMIVR